MNPVDALWAWAKGHDLANFAPRGVPDLDDAADDTLRRLARDRLLWSFLRAALPWYPATPPQRPLHYYKSE